MGVQIPQAMPRQAITLLSILMAVILVAFPSSSTIVAILVLVGGGVFLLQPKASATSISEVKMQPMSKAFQSVLRQAGEEKPAGTVNGTVSEPSVSAKVKAADEESTGKEPPQVLHQKAKPAQTESTPGPRASSAAKPELGPKVPQYVANGVEEQNKETTAVMPSGGNGSDQLRAGKEAAKRSTSGSAPLAGGAAVLARLRQQRAAKSQAPKTSEAKQVLVTYASQTGTAQEIAKGIQAESAAHGIQSKVMSLNELGFEALSEKKSPVLVIVASSTGDGDPPDNAAKFYGTMRRKSQQIDILKGVKFTTLGLGDSNYTRFMNVSRAIRSRMQELGAEPFYKQGEADEVDGLETGVDKWIADLWDPLKSITSLAEEKASVPATNGEASLEKPALEKEKDGSTDGGLVGVFPLAACRIAVRWTDDATETSTTENGLTASGDRENEGRDCSADHPFWAPVTKATYLTAKDAGRKVLHLELDLAGSRMDYQPGDSIGVQPQNETGLVEALEERMRLRSDAAFEIHSADGTDQANLLPHIPRPCTVRSALQRGCDLTSIPRKSLLRLLAEHCSDSGEKQKLLHLSSRGGREAYALMTEPHSPTLLDLLRQYPSCQPPLPDILDALPPLAPRLYSISSSPLEHRDTAHIAFTIVKIGEPEANIASDVNSSTSGNRAVRKVSGRWGVASGWLERQVEPLLKGGAEATVRLPVHLRKGGTFGHPADLSAPILMIGPGTGVAPFRGFLQHRRQLAKNWKQSIGHAILFFGCRRAGEDYLYKDELRTFAEDKTLDQLEVAFSRETEQKIYVQDIMKKQADRLAKIIRNDETYIFVCGDGAKMAKDVHNTMLSILESSGHMTSVDATAYLVAKTQAGKYIRDIWSS